MKARWHILAKVAYKIRFYTKHQLEIKLDDIDTWIFLADRTNGRASGSLLRPSVFCLSVVVVVCDVM